jgi:superfamily I DNA/RNA helicase/RecB family exonuclease
VRLVLREPAAHAFTPDAAQAAAIAHRGSPLLITGATGTGKTTTLVESVIARINAGQSPDSILILTFGRERASEIRDLIVTRTSQIAHDPLARTFHALAYSILKMRTGDNYRETVLLSGAEQESFIADLLQGDIESGYREWPDDLKPSEKSIGAPLETQGFIRELRDLMMRANERGLTPEELEARGKELGERYWPAAAAFWKRYRGSMAMQEIAAGDSKMRIDPSEIINAAIAHLQRHPELITQLRGRFITIAVDEYQESDPSQRKLLDLLAGSDLLIVADEKSAVGRFRGADPEGVAALIAGFKESLWPIINLETVHRGNAAKAAHIFKSEAEEAQFIAYQIKRAHLMQGIPYSDMAVIVRSHSVASSSIRRALGQASVPVAGDAEALAHNSSIAPFLLLARVATGQQPLNLDTCEKLLTSAFGGATSISLRRTRAALLAARDESVDTRTGTQMMIDAINDGDIPIEDKAELQRVAELLSLARKSIAPKNATIHDLLWAIWDNAVASDGQKLTESWRATALRGGQRGAAADRDLDAMVQLFDSAARHIERFPGAKPSAFLTEIQRETIVSDIITSKGVRPDVVEILTVHSAKGRQWQLVAIAGVQEGIWPNLKQRSTLLGSERLVERVRHGDDVAQNTLDIITANSLSEDEARLFHVATTRASSQLYVTAVSREDAEPSLLFENFAEQLESDANTTAIPRPITAPSLISTLRRSLTDGTNEEKIAAAGLLATLNQSQIRAADPHNWFGSLALSTDAPVVDPNESVHVSPSSAEAFNECGLKWFLERSGGTDGDSAAQLLGSVIHAYAALKVDNPELTDEALRAQLDEAWPLIDSTTGWIKRTSLARAQRMLAKFAEYHRLNERTTVGAELSFEVQIGRATVRGNVDRIEVDADGQFYVVDFKTGQSAISKEKAQDNLQLACYQLGIMLDGFEKKLGGTKVGGADLVYLGTSTKEAAIRSRGPIELPIISAEIERIAEGMGAATFTARINEMCAFCAVKSSCPLQIKGRRVIE